MSLVCNDQHLGQLTRVDLIGRVLYPRWSLKSCLNLRDVHSQTAMNGIDVGLLAPAEVRGDRFDPYYGYCIQHIQALYLEVGHLSGQGFRWG